MDKKKSDYKKQWAITIFSLLMIVIILIIGDQTFQATRKTSHEQFQVLLQIEYHKSQIFIILSIAILIFCAFYILFKSKKINGILEKDIENMTDNLKKTLLTFEEIRKIGEMANSSLNLENVLFNILKGTLKITNASVGMIFLKDTKTNSLYWGASIGLSDAFVEDYKNKNIRLGEGLTGSIAQNNECIYIPVDSSHDPRIARPIVILENLNSFIGVPIYAKEDVVGVMNILTRPPEILEKKDFSIISTIGIYVGTAIQNARLFEESIKAKELLKESEKKYRDLFNSAPDIYYSLDKNGIIIDCNETGLKILGYQKEEFVGKSLINFLTKKSQELFQETFRNFDKIKVLINAEREFIRKDNTLLPVSLNVYSENDKNGKLINTKVIARDITITKKMQQKLIESEKDLKNRIDELEKFYNMAVNRELHMKELKNEINRLKNIILQSKEDNMK